MSEIIHIGIDYGTKLGGTTAICYSNQGGLNIIQSQKNKRADEFICSCVEETKPDQVYIDAPLSLPKAYFGKGDDFFYRKADRALRAMSPMFIGGLTARAMKLKSQLENRHPSIKLIETYPGYCVREILQLKDLYNKKSKDLSRLVDRLTEILPLEFAQTPENWHQVDAAIAWYSGHRHIMGEHIEIGDTDEGSIIV